MKTVVVGITGGIAAFKMLEVITMLQKQKVSVEVILTDAAKMIVPPDQVESITGKQVYVNLFAEPIVPEKILQERKVEHIDLADRADCFVIAPATANVIAKLAAGIADDYLTTVALAVTCPIIIFPSMNVHMWESPATQENIRILRSRGYIVVEPDSGLLACGYEGKGKLPKPHIIVSEIMKLIEQTNSLSGKKILVTAGATQEPIDDVRFMTNPASGKMGASLAEALALRGATVVFIHAQNCVLPRYHHIQHIQFETADDLEQILSQEVKKADVLFHTAAVSDFRVEKIPGKLSSEDKVTLILTPREKILSKIKQWNQKIFLIGFKAEVGLSEEQLINKAQKRMEESGADVVVANEVGKADRGFAADTNEVIIIEKDKELVSIPFASKREIAEKIVSYIFHV